MQNGVTMLIRPAACEWETEADGRRRGEPR
jgi:hypothetical protein